jgi:hypothetical protein
LAEPATATVGVAKAGAITGISLSETGNTTGETFTVTLTDTNGLLSATGTGVSGAGTKALTITGSLAQVNADLATLTDTDTVTPSDTITLAATDSFGNAATAATIAVTVNGLPVLTAPATATVGVGKAGAISGLSLSETGNTTGETFTVKLTDTNGLLSATGTGVSGAGTKALTITGSLAQVNADLATLTDTDATMPSDTISVTATDSFGNAATAASVAVTVNGVPVVTAPTTAVVGVGKAIAITGLSLSETGNTTGETFTVKLSDTNGLLSATGAGVSGAGTTALTITGSLAQVNADLATLTDTDPTTPSDTISLSATDSFGNQASTTTAVTVTVNGLPVIGSPAAAIVGVGKTTAISGLSLSESGTSVGETFTVKLTDTNGLLSATGTGVSGAGTKVLTITGSAAQVNADLATVTDTDATTPSDTITMTATDSFGNSAPATAIAVTVNGLPVLTAPSTAVVGVGKANAIAGISLTETGNTTGETFTVKLTDTNGLLSATGTGVSGAGTKALTITGTLAQVNADLATLTDTDATASADTINMTAIDSFGNAATAAAVAVTVNGLPVLTAPGTANVNAGKTTAISGLSLSETGNTAGETFTVKLSDANGLLSATGTGVSGAGTKALTITGSLAQVNADLATLTDTDTTAGSDTITVATADSLGNQATASIAVQLLGQNYTLTTAPATITGTVANDTITATSGTLLSHDHIDGGTGTNTLVLSGGGSFDLGAPAQLADIQIVSAAEGQVATSGGTSGVQYVYLRDGMNVTLNVASGTPTAGNSNPETITIYGGADSSVINLGSGTDNVVLGSATETINVSKTGTALIQGISSQAGALINGSTNQTATSLEITDSGGTAVLNSADTNLTVKLDGATNLTLSKMQFITADGSAGGSTITALASNQTLLGGAGDTLIGSTAFGDLFKGTSALLNQNVIQNFGGSDQIDLTDILASKVTSFIWGTGTGGGVLYISDGTHSAELQMQGNYTLASFAYKTDGASGTVITYT